MDSALRAAALVYEDSALGNQELYYTFSGIVKVFSA